MAGSFHRALASAGFSLLELLIAVAVIVAVAAVCIPSIAATSLLPRRLPWRTK